MKTDQFCFEWCHLQLSTWPGGSSFHLNPNVFVCLHRGSEWIWTRRGSERVSERRFHASGDGVVERGRRLSFLVFATVVTARGEVPRKRHWWQRTFGSDGRGFEELAGRVWVSRISVIYMYCQPDPPENWHLTVKKLTKTWHFKKKYWQKLSFKKKTKSSFWQIFDSQMAIFRRVR